MINSLLKVKIAIKANQSTFYVNSILVHHLPSNIKQNNNLFLFNKLQ
jgi:hypothetical protein